MKSKVSTAVLLGFACAVFCSFMHEAAGSFRYPSLKEMVEKAAIIARVRIVDQRLLEFEFDGVVRPCGRALKAEVFDSLLGPRDDFWFFLADDEDYDPREKEYLVFADAYGREGFERSVKSIPEYLSKLDIERLRCTASVPYTAALAVQALIPFDTHRSRTLGGRWLRPNRMSVAHRAGGAIRSVEIDGETTIIFDWSDVEKAILMLRPAKNSAHDKDDPAPTRLQEHQVPGQSSGPK